MMTGLLIILPQKWLEVDWPFNYFLMQQAENSHFSGYCSKEKEQYVGKSCAVATQNFTRWVDKIASGSAVENAQFDPAGAW